MLSARDPLVLILSREVCAAPDAKCRQSPVRDGAEGDAVGDAALADRYEPGWGAYRLESLGDCVGDRSDDDVEGGSGSPSSLAAVATRRRE